MWWVLRRLARGSGETRALDAYDVAFLAGGGRQVADSVITALNMRGLLTMHAWRVRAVAGEQPEHAVERMVMTFCGRSKSIDAVRAAVERSPEVRAIGRRLAARGLVAGAKRRVTRRGRRQLQAARRDGSVPRYAFHGITVVPVGSPQRHVGRGQTARSRPGRTPGRTGQGQGLDGGSGSGSGWDTGSHSGGGSSGGGGGGGGE